MTSAPPPSSAKFITSLQKISWVWPALFLLNLCWLLLISSFSTCLQSPWLFQCFQELTMTVKSLPISSFSPCLKRMIFYLPCPTFGNICVVSCCLSGCIPHLHLEQWAHFWGSLEKYQASRYFRYFASCTGEAKVTKELLWKQSVSELQLNDLEKRCVKEYTVEVQELWMA